MQKLPAKTCSWIDLFIENPSVSEAVLGPIFSPNIILEAFHVQILNLETQRWGESKYIIVEGASCSKCELTNPTDKIIQTQTPAQTSRCKLYHRLTIHGPPAGIGWSWVSIPVVDMRRLGFKFGPKADTLKSPFLSMPWSSNIRQKNWRQKTDEMVANDTKMVWGWKVTYNCSETLTGTWLALQNVKQWVLKFNLGTQYVYPRKRASFIRLLNSGFFFSG